MKCRYCGRDIKVSGRNLVSVYGIRCKAAPHQKHVALSDGIHCVYCGHETKPLGNDLVTVYGVRCSSSPTCKHILQ